MKLLLSLAIAAFMAIPASLRADIVVPGADGSDFGLTITEDTVIDLSQATTAPWNASYASLAAADPDRVAADYIAKGVYDSVKWAVVFRYTEVNISEGATVTFINHPSRAPVVWLVSGDVNIAGTVSLDGQSFRYPPSVAQPGPGGFEAGVGQRTVDLPTTTTFPSGDGRGIGGGDRRNDGTGLGGAYGTGPTADDSGRPNLYGNPTLLPLIGGSGGGGAGDRVQSGGGGGGAICIATQNNIVISGILRANGGEGDSRPRSGANYRGNSGGGSGGGIRLVADTLSGDGTLQANGGVGARTGGNGRIRLERISNINSISVSPAPSTALLQEGDEPPVFLPPSAPTAKLISLGGVEAPDDPRGQYDGSEGPDLAVSDAPTTLAIVETTNLPENGTVQLRITPEHGDEYTLVNATFDAELSNIPLILRWSAQLPIGEGYSAVQVRIALPNSNP